MTDHLFRDAETKMSKAVDATRSDFASVRTGRATPALLDRVSVEAYGQAVPLKQVAGISTPDARTLLISAWDRSTVVDIRKAIEKSDLGLTPNIDGQNIRLIVPPLTEERRKDLVKVIRKKAEEGKIAVRNVRHKFHDDIKAQLKEHKMTEDDSKRAQDNLQKSTDRYVKEIDVLAATKEKEIMEV